MINKYSEITGLSEADFNKLRTEFGLTDDLMQTIINDKMNTYITSNLKIRCVWYCMAKEFGEFDAKFIFYSCLWKAFSFLADKPNRDKLLKGYERYKYFFKDN